MPNWLGEQIATWRPVVVFRNEPLRAPDAFPQQTLTYVPAVRSEEAPRPVPYSAFSGVGRDAGHAPTPLRRYQQLAFSEWLSVMGWPFAVAKVPSALVVSMPRGRAIPVRERTNIHMTDQTALGSLATMDGNMSTAPQYAKITF